MKPAETINKTPGNNCCHGASLKKIQPNKNEDGIPKYSKEASLLNEISLYAYTNNIAAVPPSIPVKTINSKSLKLLTVKSFDKITNKKNAPLTLNINVENCILEVEKFEGMNLSIITVTPQANAVSIEYIE